MSLHQRITTDLKQAMKEKNVLKRDVLRYLNSQIKQVQVDKNIRENDLPDEDVVAVIKKALKQRKDAIEQYSAGGREDLAQKEHKEVDILKVYLPEELSKDAIQEHVRRVIEKDFSADSLQMGPIMGKVLGDLKGKADGALVREVVEEEIRDRSQK
jgi:uncharacterized protein YqeY